MSKENGVADTVGNIVKYVEKQTNKDIMDFNNIIIYVFENRHYNVKYHMSKNSEGILIDCKYSKVITNKSQIHNRLQYIRQSGHQLENITYSGKHIGKEYISDGDTLEIELM